MFRCRLPEGTADLSNEGHVRPFLPESTADLRRRVSFRFAKKNRNDTNKFLGKKRFKTTREVKWLHSWVVT